MGEPQAPRDRPGTPSPQPRSPSTQRQPACRAQAYMSTRDWDMSWSPTRYVLWDEVMK